MVRALIVTVLMVVAASLELQAQKRERELGLPIGGTPGLCMRRGGVGPVSENGPSVDEPTALMFPSIVAVGAAVAARPPA